MAAVTPAATPAAAPAAKPTDAQAIDIARRTGKAVVVDAATTASNTVTANPDGSLTLTESVVPVRKLISGQWRNLDATLHLNPDGTISPAVTTDSVTLSNGGAGALATMTSGGRRLALTAPMTLPKPTLAGDTATYANILSGVDLQVRAGLQGELSEILVVHNRAAAANPALKAFSFGTVTDGFTLAAAADGSLSGTDPAGRPVLSAPPAIMWDSTAGTGRTVPDLRTGRALDVTTGAPAVSDARTAGVAARRGAVGVRVTGGRLVLTPSPAMLGGIGVKFPEFIDPTVTWSPANGPFTGGWAVVSNGGTTTKYWKNSPSGSGDAQAGLAPGVDDVRRTLLNFTIPSTIFGTATVVHTAALNVWESWAWNCTAQKVDVYAPAADLTSANADWNSWPSSGWGSQINQQNKAYGYNSSCPAHGIGFDVTSAVANDGHNSNGSQTFLIKADNEGTESTWKRFEISGANAPTLNITYNRPPSTPANLSTSPATACTAGTPTVVGDAPVTLIAPVSDPDANLLGVTYKLWKTSDGTQTAIYSTDPNTFTASSGTSAQAIVPQATLDTAAAGAVTGFSWKVDVWDGGITSAWSVTCNFSFDPTRAGAPTVASTSSLVMGQPATFSVTPPSGVSPASYTYQLNAGPPVSVGLGVPIKLTPTRFTNVLTVSSISAGGNLGDAAVLWFNATPPATPALDSDLNGDAAADVLIQGGGLVSATGLWQATGRNDGSITPVATNIGLHGNGVSGAYSPGDFTGSQAITGRFAGSGLQDVLVYEPASTAVSNPGGAELLNGAGDGSVLQTQIGGNEHTVQGGSFTDGNGDDPVQLANAADTSLRGQVYPDLIGISGDNGSGWYLNYYLADNSLVTWEFPSQLGNLPPDGVTSWKDWSIATTQMPTGTAMFLWNATTGGLYLWADLAYSNGTLTYTPYTLSTNWNKLPASPLHLQAANLDGNGTPDLWAIDNTGKVTPYLVTLGATPAISAGTAQSLITSAHSWPLSDIGANNPGQPVTASADVAGTLNLTGGTTAQWNTGDLFSPDAKLTGVSTGTLSTSTKVVSTDGDFTVSAWVKLTATGGTLFSQNGTNAAGFKVWADSSDSSWRFAMSTSDVASPAWDLVQAPAGSAGVGQWAKITATYNHTTGAMNLYANGLRIAYGTHTTKWAANGAFQIGQVKTGASTYGAFLNGQVAMVDEWNTAADPTAATSPASYYVPVTPVRITDTRAAFRIGSVTGPLTAGQVVKIKIAGASGVPTDAITAVALNISVLPSSTGGFLSAYPDLVQRPVTSTINFPGGAPLENLAVVPVGSNGYVDLYINSAGANLAIDMSGYYTSDVQNTAITSYAPVTPFRLIDSRIGLGVPTGQVLSTTAPAVQVGGVNGIPAGGSTPGSLKAVVLNLTGNAATSSGWFAPYADGTALPTPYSTTQFPLTSATASLVIAPVGANGKIDIFVGAGAGKTDLIGDVVGYFIAGTGGQKFYTVNATRLLDTRITGSGTPVPANTVTRVSQGTLIQAQQPTMVLNVTPVSPTGSGVIVVYADGTTKPATSNINFASGSTISNADFATAGSGAGAGAVDIYNQMSAGTNMHLVVDCLGYYSAH